MKPTQNKTITLYIIQSLFIALLAYTIPACYAEDTRKTSSKSPAPGDKANIIMQTTEEEFRSMVDSVKTAIENKGLLISKTMHISDMLNRTAKNMGVKENIYQHAEGLEFCSASLSHKMAKIHPNNIAVCPFTIVVYQLTNDDKVNVAYQQATLTGDGAEIEKEITKLFDEIIEDATSW